MSAEIMRWSFSSWSSSSTNAAADDFLFITQGCRGWDLSYTSFDRYITTVVYYDERSVYCTVTVGFAYRGGKYGASPSFTIPGFFVRSYLCTRSRRFFLLSAQWFSRWPPPGHCRSRPACVAHGSNCHPPNILGGVGCDEQATGEDHQ